MTSDHINRTWKKAMPPINKLSQELVDDIIDALAMSTSDRYQRRSLSSCALVCRSFLPRSQMHLFSCVVLMDGHKDGSIYERTKIRSFLDIITAHPSIAGHVQDLHLTLRDGESSWLYKKNGTRILDMIATTGRPIVTLTLAEVEDHGIHVLQRPWTLIERCFRPYFATSITSLRLHTLKDIPPQLVTMCSKLQELSLIYAQFMDLPVPPNNRPAIKRLEYVIGEDEPELEILSTRMLAYLDLSNIHSFSAYIDGRATTLDFEQKIINGCKDSLEELTIDIHDYGEYGSVNGRTALNLQHLRNLQSLTLVASTSTPNGFADVCSTLRTVSRLGNFCFVLSILNKFELEKVYNADWTAFYHEISRISTASGQPCLLSLYMHYYPDPDELETGCKKHEVRAERILKKITKNHLDSNSCQIVSLDVSIEKDGWSDPEYDSFL